MRRTPFPVLTGVAALLAACSDDQATRATGSLVPLAGAYAYRSVTRGDVVLNGAMILFYTGADSLSGEMIASDPQGRPYIDGHVLGIRQRDGSYLFEAPKAEMEPTASRYVHRILRTRTGYTCELRDQRQGNTVTTVCALNENGS